MLSSISIYKKSLIKISSSSITSLSSIKMNSELFFQSNDIFAVVGASLDRSKFGNKVLRCYQSKNFNVVPISKKEKIIEDITCLSSLTELCNINPSILTSKIGVSIITPPNITISVIDEGYSLGIRNFFLQPGTIHEEDAKNIIKKFPEVNIIQSCVLIDLC